MPAHLIPFKIQDHQRTNDEFTQLVEERLKALKTEPKMRSGFIAEMRRFLPAAIVRGTLENPVYWEFLNQTLREQASLAFKALVLKAFLERFQRLRRRTLGVSQAKAWAAA